MYVKFLPSEYVIRYKKGKIVSEGTGLSFFFMEKNTTACAIPTSNNDADFVFTETTKDFQSVTVQGQLTYQITDYKQIAKSMDFTVNLKTKNFFSDPMMKLSKRIKNICEVLLKSRIDSVTIQEAITFSRTLAQDVLKAIQTNAEIKNLGIAVSGFSILKISPTPETGRALEAKTREEILRQADDALYERRNASIEQERRVKENELSTEVSVEEKKKKIKASEIDTKKMLMEKENEFKKYEIENKLDRDRMEVEAEAERQRIRIESELELERKRQELAELKYENAKKNAEAEAFRISAVMDAYNKINPEVLIALAGMNMEPQKIIAQAFEKLAINSSKIGQLNITPDLLESVMGKNNG